MADPISKPAPTRLSPTEQFCSVEGDAPIESLPVASSATDLVCLSPEPVPSIPREVVTQQGAGQQLGDLLMAPVATLIPLLKSPDLGREIALALAYRIKVNGSTMSLQDLECLASAPDQNISRAALQAMIERGRANPTEGILVAQFIRDREGLLENSCDIGGLYLMRSMRLLNGEIHALFSSLGLSFAVEHEAVLAYAAEHHYLEEGRESARASLAEINPARAAGLATSDESRQADSVIATESVAESSLSSSVRDGAFIIPELSIATAPSLSEQFGPDHLDQLSPATPSVIILPNGSNLVVDPSSAFQIIANLSSAEGPREDRFSQDCRDTAGLAPASVSGPVQAHAHGANYPVATEGGIQVSGVSQASTTAGISSSSSIGPTRSQRIFEITQQIAGLHPALRSATISVLDFLRKHTETSSVALQTTHQASIGSDTLPVHFYRITPDGSWVAETNAPSRTIRPASLFELVSNRHALRGKTGHASLQGYEQARATMGRVSGAEKSRRTERGSHGTLGGFGLLGNMGEGRVPAENPAFASAAPTPITMNTEVSDLRSTRNRMTRDLNASLKTVSGRGEGDATDRDPEGNGEWVVEETDSDNEDKLNS